MINIPWLNRLHLTSTIPTPSASCINAMMGVSMENRSIRGAAVTLAYRSLWRECRRIMEESP